MAESHDYIGNKNNSKKAPSQAGGAPTAAPGATIVSIDELREIRGKAEKGKKADAVVLTQGEIERMKQSTKVQTKDQEVQ